jgi:hypothetical protein
LAGRSPAPNATPAKRRPRRALAPAVAFHFALILSTVLFSLLRLAMLLGEPAARARPGLSLLYLALMATPIVWAAHRLKGMRDRPAGVGPAPPPVTPGQHRPFLRTSLILAGLCLVLFAAWRWLPARLALLESAWAVVAAALLPLGWTAAGWARGVWAGTLFSLAALAGVEAILGWFPAPKLGLPDYAGLFEKPLHEGGYLKPGVDAEVIGAGGPVRWITNSAGFRNAREFDRRPDPGTIRILYLGDSFVAGYRTDQRAMSGWLLEERLNGALREAGDGRRAEVIVAAVENPGTGVEWLRRYGLAYRPRLVVYGVCIGNDAMQTWYEDPKILLANYETPMPADAMRPPSAAGRAWWRASNFLAARTRLGGRLRVAADRIWPMGIARQFDDPPGEMHLLDGVSGLGLCYRPMPAPVEAAFGATIEALAEMDRMCGEAGARLLTVLFPQRYQVSDRDWRAAVRSYRLDPARFDRDQPMRRLTEGLAARGVTPLDLTGPFREEAGARQLFQPLGDMHWNDAGHALAARAMAEAIVDDPAWPPGETPAETSADGQ